MYGGSGELIENASEEKKSNSSSGMTSDLQSYLDPPIENYRAIYSSKMRSPNASRSNSQSNQNPNYFTGKKQNKRGHSGVGGTDSYRNSKVNNPATTSNASDAHQNGEQPIAVKIPNISAFVKQGNMATSMQN